MKILTIPLGPVQANCYIYMDKGFALVVDPGDDFEIQKILDQYDVKLEAILLTHAHFDHIGGVQSLVDTYQIPVYINPNEAEYLGNAKLNASASFFMNVEIDAKPVTVVEGKQTIGHFEVEAMFLPGHSIGSTAYIIGNCMFTGDVLFKGSIGRTDLPSGDYRQMNQSLSRIKALKTDYHILPGHGPLSTLREEKEDNFYLR